MTSLASDEPETRVELASRSDVGQMRAANEDSCDIFERADGTRLLVVADGMGGHRGGATASRIAVSTITEIFDRDHSAQIEEMIQRAIETANQRIHEMAQQDRELEGMGTTVVAFVLDADHHGTVAHVGDSRAYRHRQGRLEALTADHSVVAEMHSRGLITMDEAAIHPRRNEILRSVGALAKVEVEVAAVDVAPGDQFVLCSDGLTGVVSDEEIAAVVESETPGMAVDSLIQMANDRGGPDNITVQVLSISAQTTERAPRTTEAIENERRERRRAPRLLMLIVALILCGGAYFLWQSFLPAPEEMQSVPTQDRSSGQVELD